MLMSIGCWLLAFGLGLLVFDVCFWLLAYGLRFSVSGFWCLVSAFRFPFSGFSFLVSCFRFSASAFPRLVSSFSSWFPSVGIRLPIFGFCVGFRLQAVAPATTAAS